MAQLQSVITATTGILAVLVVLVVDQMKDGIQAGLLKLTWLGFKKWSQDEQCDSPKEHTQKTKRSRLVS